MELLNKVERIAKDAAKIFNKTESSRVILNSGKDIKLAADIESQEFIINELKKISDYPILSEELENHLDIEQEDIFWVIDPLDGTYNFKKEIPFSCLSIGLWKKNSPYFGVIYDFNHNHLFSGGKSLGSFVNGTPLSISSTEDLSQSSLATGLPIQMDLSQENFQKYTLKLPLFKKIRMLGSAATSLALVAKGSIDSYYEQNIYLWDVCAGLAICEGAGGEYTLQNNGNYQFDVLVSNKKIHQQLRELWMN